MPKRKAATNAKVAAPRPKKANNTTNYVLWDTFNDLDMLVEDVGQGMARVVAYDTDASQQIFAFLAKCAGLKGSPSIEITKNTARNIENLCEGAAASYPLSVRKYATRFDHLITHFFTSIFEAQAMDSLGEIFEVVAQFANAHLRSIRHVAVAFCAPMLGAIKSVLALPHSDRQKKVYEIDEVEKAGKIMAEILTARLGDVSPQIRALSVGALDFKKAFLDDEAAIVRLTALEHLAWSKADAAAKKRVEEIAEKDIDPKCRLAAISLLPHPSRFLADTNPEIAQAAAQAFSKLGQLEEISTPISKPAAIALAKQFHLRLETAKTTVIEHPELLVLIYGVCAADGDQNEQTSAELIEVLSTLLTEFSHNDELLASTLQLSRFIDLDAIVKRNMEDDAIRLFKLACSLFQEHPAGPIRAAFTIIAEKFISHSATSMEARTLLDDIFEQIILNHEESMEDGEHEVFVQQVATLGRFIDVSNYATDQVYEEHRDAAQDLACAVAFNGDALSINKAIEYLRACDPVPFNKLMQVLITAKLRDINVEFSVDEINVNKVSKRLVAAARAAEIV